MKAMLDEILRALCDGQDVVLCTVLASSGSTPRGAGSRMAVFCDGRTLGTVGGGRVEQLSVARAMEVHQTGVPVMQGYALSGGDIADIGMVCGGRVAIYFQRIAAADKPARELLQRWYELADSNENAWLVCRLCQGVMTETALYDAARGLQFAQGLHEDDVLPLLSSDAVLTPGDPSLYLEPIAVRGTVYVFGGGHVGKEVVALLAHVGFRVAVYDDREALATRDAFPAACEVFCGAYAAFPDKITLTEDDYAVVMTPGHQADFTVLERVLRTKAAYIGCIGSHSKIRAVNERLLQAGLTEGELARVHAPIGLPIGGKTPAEIAVSIAAELIQHRSRLRAHK